MKRHIHFELKSEANTSFFCIKAANSVDLDVKKKLSHVMDLDVDFQDEWNVGLIVGASGSGKTTLAQELYGHDCFATCLDLSQPVINQFPSELSYDERVEQLISVGLSQVPCWIRPAGTLSNGQRFRAEIALQMCRKGAIVAIDEWTSVVDRTIAKIMSNSVQKHARKFSKRIVLCSCHYDVIEWLQPDWIIDCNEQTFRRCLRQERREKLTFDIREIDGKTWPYFSKYHYLSDRLPGGKLYFFGLFHGDRQIGFQCFANYVLHKDKSKKMILHSNRVVIHPDFVGFGLGQLMTDETSRIISGRGFRVMAKFSSIAMYRSRKKNPRWVLRDEGVFTDKGGLNAGNTVRSKQKWWSFEYLGDESNR